MKDIKDFLKYYIGCDITVPYENEPCRMVAINQQSAFIDSGCDYLIEEVKPLLYPLSAMTEEQAIEAFKADDYYMGSDVAEVIQTIKNIIKSNQYRPLLFHYLLSQYFDLFNLIPEGLAIDKTTYKVNV